MYAVSFSSCAKTCKNKKTLIIYYAKKKKNMQTNTACDVMPKPNTNFTHITFEVTQCTPSPPRATNTQSHTGSDCDDKVPAVSLPSYARNNQGELAGQFARTRMMM